MQTSSEKTITAAVPSRLPAPEMPSKSIGVSRWSAVSIGVEDPPGVQALRALPSGSPPAAPRMTSRAGTPRGNSKLPGLTTSPETLNSLGPGDFSVPMERNQSTPLRTIQGTVAIVSTLLTVVGARYRPSTAGNGGGQAGGLRVPPPS